MTKQLMQKRMQPTAINQSWKTVSKRAASKTLLIPFLLCFMFPTRKLLMIPNTNQPDPENGFA